MHTISTIGHSTRSFAEFLEKLREHDVQVLVDVRSIPRSRFNPHYNERALRDALAREGIEYLGKGNNLGGKRENVRYEETIDELAARVKGGERLCLMCSEGDYKKCHRHLMLEPSLLERGILANHILYTKKS